MGHHDMAYTMAYHDVNRRDYGTGSVFQRCEKRYGCPPLVDGKRPAHTCQGRWFGVMEDGFTPSGKRRRTSVSAKTKSAAQRKLRDKIAERNTSRGSVRRTVTVAAWAAEWLEVIERRETPSAFSTDRAAVRWIVGTIGHVKVADLTPAHVRKVAAAVRAAGNSSSTALRYHGPLTRMLKAASAEGYAVPPNVLDAERPIKAVSDRQAVTTEQIEAVFHTLMVSHAEAHPDASRWTVAFLQGMRQAEALGLTWDAVTPDAVHVSWQVKPLRYVDPSAPERGFVVPDGYEVRHLVGSYHLTRPKSRAGWRVIPLVPYAAVALERWRAIAPENEHGLVWPGRRIRRQTWPRNPQADREEWARIQAEAKIAHPSGRPYKVHEIRHSTATLLMELKVPEAVRIAIMGHSSIASTHSYEHADLEQARDALAALAGRLGLPSGG